MSQQATSPTPPPKAAPWTRAMVGFGNSSSTRIRRARARASARFSCSPAAAMPRIQFRSAPAENEAPAPSSRSEEHTSELQSLMRISYAVFCLKKKNNKSVQLFLIQYHSQIFHL